MTEIIKVAKKAGFKAKELEQFGHNLAKVNALPSGKEGKLILVTAMTSNATGIGKTTTSIGLADALRKMKKKAVLALREPSMGPVFGVKGGATGGGKASITPSDEINLHFTGDFHAIAQANNLLSSIIDNHIFQGNQLGIDTQNIFFKRCLDVNDRSLRHFEYKIGDDTIKSGFNITAASETMAISCLSHNTSELKQNLGNILVAMSKEGKPIYAKDLHAEDAMTILLKDAMKPNLVRSLEGCPALVHFGPFANIAHGCNSIIATQLALTHADYCITEAGFGSDLGAEKFIDIKSRLIGHAPDAVVLVIVAKVIKEHGNGDIVAGFENVKKHIFNLREVFHLPFVVAINLHTDDDKQDIALIEQLCQDENVQYSLCTQYTDGSAGCMALAKQVLQACKQQTTPSYSYELTDDIKTKIESIAKKVYGAGSVSYSDIAKQKIALAEQLGCGDFFVNIAKTQFSFTADKSVLGAPTDFDFFISDIEIRSGAKMIVAIAGNMLLMPGLNKSPNYLRMSIDDNGIVKGVL